MKPYISLAHLGCIPTSSTIISKKGQSRLRPITIQPLELSIFRPNKIRLLLARKKRKQLRSRQPTVSATYALASKLFPVIMSSSLLTSKTSYQEYSVYIEVVKKTCSSTSLSSLSQVSPAAALLKGDYACQPLGSLPPLPLAYPAPMASGLLVI